MGNGIHLLGNGIYLTILEIPVKVFTGFCQSAWMDFTGKSWMGISLPQLIQTNQIKQQ